MMMMRSAFRAASAALCLTVLLAGCGSQQTAAPASAPGALPDFTGLVRDTAPSVVNISTVPEQPGEQARQEPPEGGTPSEDWFRRFFEERGERPGGPPQRPSLGSGFIISEDGYILTNKHVVSDKGRIVVKLNDRRQMTAELIGSDEYSDIALVRVDAEDLPAVTTGDPKALKPGSWVVAIGSPFGFETSVTAGIVSAKKRSLADDQYVPFIQTDVAINPGNSGGPLFNLDGEVVGVNAQIYSRSGGFQGVSFAIPIDVAMDVAEQLKDGGTVRRGWLGVQIQEVDLALAESFGMARPEGALVSQILPDSPAGEAGLQAGDVILRFDDRPVPDASSLPQLVGLIQPGNTVEVAILRDGERQTVDVTVGELERDGPPGVQQPGQPEDTPDRDLGLELRDLTADERDQQGIAEGGVRVEAVEDGPGRRAGLRAGDIILAIGPETVAGARDLRRRLAAVDGPVALRVVRDGAAMYVPFDPD